MSYGSTRSLFTCMMPVLWLYIFSPGSNCRARLLWWPFLPRQLLTLKLFSINPVLSHPHTAYSLVVAYYLICSPRPSALCKSLKLKVQVILRCGYVGIYLQEHWKSSRQCSSLTALHNTGILLQNMLAKVNVFWNVTWPVKIPKQSTKQNNFKEF